METAQQEKPKQPERKLSVAKQHGKRHGKKSTESRHVRHQKLKSDVSRLYEIIKSVHDEASTFRDEAVKSINTIFDNQREVMKGLVAAEENLRAQQAVLNDLVADVLHGECGCSLALLDLESGRKVDWPKYHADVIKEMTEAATAASALEKSLDVEGPVVDEHAENVTVFGGDAGVSSKDEQ